MTLIIEDGSIVANADSYINVADTITFLNSYYSEYDEEAAAFLGLSTSRQEVILRQSTYVLDRRYRERWKGYKNVQTQSLDWPRSDVNDEDGWAIPTDSIQRRILRAEVEIAKRVANSVDIFEDQSRGGRVQSEKVDVIAIAYFADAPSTTLFEGLDAVLKGLLKTENRIVRA